MPDFDGLRQRLEAAARPPAFAEIRARRATRTRRRIVAGAALATAVVLAASVATTAGLRGLGEPVEPAVTLTTPAPAPTIDAAAQPWVIQALATTSSGQLFAIIQRCKSPCRGDLPPSESALVSSSDLGAHWLAIAPLDGLPSRLLAADETHLWTVSSATVAGSADGGRTWQQWTLSAPNGSDVRSSIASGTAWFTYGGEVWRATAGGAPVLVGTVTPDGSDISSLTAVDDRRAYAWAGLGWRATGDAGAHWADVADPCGHTQFVGSPFSTMAAAPDGSLWVVCSGGGGAGNMPKDLVVSTDAGQTWAKRGQLETAGYGTDVYPFSATTAWRTGARADIFRTTDGTHWTDLANLESNGPAAFTAIDANTAVYVFGLADAAVHTTRDGGATWTSYPAPAVS